jgi:hypothetical protein
MEPRCERIKGLEECGILAPVHCDGCGMNLCERCALETACPVFGDHKQSVAANANL